jgi:hypothetical protein
MQPEQVGWFQPGSISLSFLIFSICVVALTMIVAGLVRYLMRRNLAQEGGMHH